MGPGSRTQCSGASTSPLPFMPKYICIAQGTQGSVTCEQAHLREFGENFGGQQRGGGVGWGRKSEIHINILLNDIQFFL